MANCLVQKNMGEWQTKQEEKNKGGSKKAENKKKANNKESKKRGKQKSKKTKNKKADKKQKQLSLSEALSLCVTPPVLSLVGGLREKKGRGVRREGRGRGGW